mgnify:CR=1 FL=1
MYFDAGSAKISIVPRSFELYVYGYEEDKEGWIGTLLTLANGRFSVRGVLDISYRRDKASFMMGLYSDVPIWNRELVALPAINSVYVLSSQRTVLRSVVRRLDMMNGVLFTDLELLSNSGNIVSYSSEALVNRVYKDLYMQRVRVSSSEESVSLVLPIENSLNPFLYGYTYTEHLSRSSVEFNSDEVKILFRSRDGDNVLIRMILRYRGADAIKSFISRDSAGFILTGRDVVVEKYVFIDKLDVNRLDNKGLFELNWDRLAREHSGYWRDLWNRIGLEIIGDENISSSVIFYTYHLLQLIDEEADELMIPPRGLHGLGYRGHVFWDADIYLLPFLVFLFPRAMRRLLEFRCRTLDSAKRYAEETGFRGARYPWEADDRGSESTPRYYPIDLSRCRCVDILTGEQEIHVTGDVAFAVDLYYTATGDKEFLRKCGLRMLIEIARFWASRVEYDPSKRLYVIRSVIGPDEYHVGVNNNFYTNYIAKYSLRAASRRVLEAFRDQELRSVLDEYGVDMNEVVRWNEISDKLYLGRIVDGVIEQFENYFDLYDVETKGYEIHRVDISRLSEINKTKLIKQADVVLALVLKELVEGVDPEILRKNYDYYLKRTTHESSLSLPIYATAGFIIGDPSAPKLFEIALKTDLENLYNNTHDGFHIAAAGGLWYAILIGILGLRLRNEELIANPVRVEGLKIALNINYRGSIIRISS